MWELIRANKRKSVILFMCMGLCLILLGYFIGMTFYPPNGGINGILIALMIWFVMTLISYFGGDSIMLHLSGAQEVTHDVHPQLFNIVEEMKVSANWPYMPKIYIISDPAPNAFATGIRPEKTAIAVTAGLLSMVNRDELQGVIAHEMSHIMNRDVLFMTFAGVLMGSIVLISEVFLRSLWFSGGSSRRYRSRSSSNSGGQAQIIIIVIAIVFAILSPIIAQLLYFAMSRKREYLADASAVRLTRYPEGLASALEKISGSKLDLASANKVSAPMYIINPLKPKGMKMSDVTSTHPPISERIKILRSMQQGVNFVNYQKAFDTIREKHSRLMPVTALKDNAAIGVRGPSEPAKAEPRNVKTQTRDLGDLIRAVNKYAFITCLCGLKIKVPPDFKEPDIKCPRCGRRHVVPQAELAAARAILGSAVAIEHAAVNTEGKEASSGSENRQQYTRQGHGWETFSCKCGKTIQLSPSFSASSIRCSKCSRQININNV